ncbi:MAG: NBR1-Ig-like domain-containing protein [Chloroflexota bacterium]
MIALLMRMLLACVPVALILSACGPAGGDTAPTLAVDAIFTAARQTFSAQAATLTATRPTGTPPPTLITAASPSLTLAAGGPGLCDNSLFVSDVTIPDGAVIAAGSAFAKTWLLQNTGTCTWTSGYSLSFHAGDLMGGTDALVAIPVPSGSQSALSVNLTAPTSPGAYTGQWRMKNKQQQPFGNILTVVINVGPPTECRRSSRVDVTISGHAGPENVTIDYGDGTVSTDPKGDYAFTVPAGWSGTVIPSKAKVNPWTFDPQHRTYTNVTCDLRNEDYKATAPPGV